MKNIVQWGAILTAAVCVCLESPVLAVANYPEVGSDSTASPAYQLAQAEQNSHVDWANQCSSLIDRQKFEEALAACDNAVKIKPDYSLGLTNRCVALGQLDRYEEAVNSCDSAVKGDGDWGQVSAAGGWTNLGASLLLVASKAETREQAMPLLQSALDAFDQALEIDPNYSKAQQIRDKLEQLMRTL